MKKPEIRSYAEWQLRELYGVGYKAWQEWIRPYEKDIGPILGKRYTPKQVRIIFDKLDPPYTEE